MHRREKRDENRGREGEEAGRQALVEDLKFTLVLRLSIMFSLSKDLCFL